MIEYVSTRGGAKAASGAQAIIAGLAPDRGLYVPTEFPAFGMGAALEAAAGAGGGYKAIAAQALSAFLPDFTEAEIGACVEGAYDAKFDTAEIAPLRETKDAFFLELWRGPTAAFKDMALAILPRLLMAAVGKTGESKRIAILAATSGDTGKAALAGFADVPGTEIFVFYPKDGVSAVQERQMVTQEGGNVHVFGIHGNFDDAQAAVKDVFDDAAFAGELSGRGIRLSSANSINIGRLLPQVAYYVSAYARLRAAGRLADGERFNVCVPTGNFGNILAAYYAKRIGVPIARLVCASNENDVLTEFLSTGAYNARRPFFMTSSPSMDILVSSNLERLLWHLSGGDGEATARLMEGLANDGCYTADARTMEGLADAGFYGGSAGMERAHAAIGALWAEERYLIDTHTAVGYAAYLDYREATGDTAPAVIASTASPYKFAGSVSSAIGLGGGQRGGGPQASEFQALEALAESTGVPVPAGLRGLAEKPVLHTQTIEKDGLRAAIENAVG